MLEKRVKISDFAFTTIVNAQLHLNEVQRQTKMAQDELSRVLMLILDSRGLPLDTQVGLDPQTKELVYSVPE